jgi:transcription elongation factor Elf1
MHEEVFQMPESLSEMIARLKAEAKAEKKTEDKTTPPKTTPVNKPVAKGSRPFVFCTDETGAVIEIDSPTIEAECGEREGRSSLVQPKPSALNLRHTCPACGRGLMKAMCLDDNRQVSILKCTWGCGLIVRMFNETEKSMDPYGRGFHAFGRVEWDNEKAKKGFSTANIPPFWFESRDAEGSVDGSFRNRVVPKDPSWDWSTR